MSKGSYPVVDKRGKLVGRYFYEGDRKGWVYRPMPKPAEWIVLSEESA